jgi:hypothetical protein
LDESSAKGKKVKKSVQRGIATKKKKGMAALLHMSCHTIKQ